MIAIIAIIAAILFPVFARTREKARQASCLSNEKQIAAGWLMYLQDYDETFPFVLNWSANFIMAQSSANRGDGGRIVLPGATGQEPQFQLVTVVAPYVKNESIWYCPSVGPGYVWEWGSKSGTWKRGATMRDQGTSYAYTFLAFPYPYNDSRNILMGGKSYAILREPSRWPMLFDEPIGCGFTGNIGDPPASVIPHFGGVNVVYGDGHAKFFRMERASGDCSMRHHLGDGVFPDQ